MQTVTQNLGNEVKSWMETADPGLVQLEWRVTWGSPQIWDGWGSQDWDNLGVQGCLLRWDNHASLLLRDPGLILCGFSGDRNQRVGYLSI